MQKYIFGTRNNVEVFNLELTSARLSVAKEFIKALGKEGQTVLWVGTKAPAKRHVESVGKKLNMPYVSGRWLGGTLTNFKIFEQRLSYWKQLEDGMKKGQFEDYSKKERLLKSVELKKLDRTFGGLRTFTALPSAIVIVDTSTEKTALAEAKIKNIPVVALINVNSNPEDALYPIPANDSASSTIALVLNELASAYEEGFAEKKSVANNN